MTITLQAGHTYLLRNGTKVTLTDRDPNRNYPWKGIITELDGTTWRDTWTDTGSVWRATQGNDYDIVEEVLPAAQPASPVRQRTVTEIVPGDYGIARVGDTDKADPKRPDVDFCVHTQSCTAEELRALAATATQLADALDIIASENQN